MKFARKNLHARVARGFTLIEITATLAILVLLAAIAFGAFKGVRTRALKVRAQAELQLLVRALEEYKRQYGEYPMTGRYQQANPIEVDPTRTVAVNTVQAKFFNALCGVYGPRAFNQVDALNGKMFVDLSKLTVEVETTRTNSVPQVGNDPTRKQEVANSFVDPWGRRYLYYYKRDDQSPTATRPWQNPSYVLFSAGPDGDYQAPGTFPGFVDAAFLALQKSGAPVNADNIYANPY